LALADASHPVVSASQVLTRRTTRMSVLAVRSAGTQVGALAPLS